MNHDRGGQQSQWRLSTSAADGIRTAFFCKSESLSEEGLREMIERHGLAPNNHNVDDYYFFYQACKNERVTEGIIRYLLEYFPDAASVANKEGNVSLHWACENKNVTLNLVQLLIDAAPESIRRANNCGDMPINVLCANEDVGKMTAIKILKFLLMKYPEAVRQTDEDGRHPIHIAASWGGYPEFCHVLIEAYPGSERLTTNSGRLPLYNACLWNTVAMVEYLYELYPEAIHLTTTKGHYPIHAAIQYMKRRDNHETALEIVQFLLASDPSVKLQKYLGRSLLHFACRRTYDDSSIQAALEVINVIYDSNPEAIEENVLISGIEGYHQEVQAFLNGELVYARHAKDNRHMTTPDMNGQLPLHRALQNNIRLGSIKLLVEGNPAALQSADNSDALPLHVACMHHDSSEVIDYLVGLDPSTLDAVDGEGNAALHLACRNARHGIIALFLEKYGAVSVSTRNADKKLPIELLWESVPVEDRESIGYIENVYRLLRANPGMMMGIGAQTLRSPASTSSTLPCQTGKKRKFGQ